MFGRKDNRYREDGKQNIFVVGVIILSFVVTLGLSFIFSGKGFLSLAGLFGKESTTTFYAIAIGGYDDMALARGTAELVKSRGGAGYIVKNADEDENKIEIVFAVYNDKNSAEQVLNSLDDRAAYLKEIVVKDSALSWCEGDLKSAVKDALTYFDIAFDGLYSTSNLLNDNAISIGDAKTKIKVLYAHIEDIKSVFYQKTQNHDKQQITEIKLALITALALLDGIEYGSSAATCSSTRYALVQLVYCFSALMQAV